ncbi:sensor histidine kinase [Hippea maritima]|uniref:histidine kinase n=1 Tax=Hippea maritima (strain ATCC 700847 / DSM 10411 / MH2) TaxID=760142 RepID=F2LVS0_HIPMA|nr:ATP-binding protein [Hippea maritima]AEA33854.1 multi-sensor signal transduction histidine kinase [Hippea maritima DSM 10411]
MKRFVHIFSVLLIFEIITTVLVGLLFFKKTMDLTTFLNKLSILFIFLFILSLFTSYIITEKEEDIYLSIESLINKMKNENKLILPETDDIVLHRIYSAIKRIYNILKRQQNSIEQEKEKLKSIINALNEGLILVNYEGEIELINPAAIQFLGLKENKGNLFDLCKDFKILTVLQSVITTKKESLIESNDKILLLKSQTFNKKTIILINDISQREKYQRMKAKFFEEASHELKTPITSIMGFSETLLNSKGIDKKTQEKFLKYIYESAQHLTELIEDILTLHRLESRNVSKKGECHIGELREQLNAAFGQIAKNKGLDFQVSCEAAKVNIPCGHLKSILWNLVDNAINFTETGFVRVNCKIIGNRSLTITVEDSGIGIEESDRQRIFERFYTSRAGRDRKLSGTGLGLAIVKHTVNLYGGKIELSSKKGEGSRFVIILSIP